MTPNFRKVALIALAGLGVAGLVWFIAGIGTGAGADPLGEDAPNLVYLGVLLAVLLASLVASRPQFREVGKAVLVWGGLGLVLVAGYAFKDDLSMIARRTAAAIVPGMSVSDGSGAVMVMRSSDNHFHIRANLAGTPVDFLVDTGATTTTLSNDDARRIGVDVERLSYTVPIMTANGQTGVAHVTTGPLIVGDIRIEKMDALVTPSGKLGTSLLGMNFLNRMSSWRVEGDRLIFTP